jgi:hypothetical protein
MLSATAHASAPAALSSGHLAAADVQRTEMYCMGKQAGKGTMQHGCPQLWTALKDTLRRAGGRALRSPKYRKQVMARHHCPFCIPFQL